MGRTLSATALLALCILAIAATSALAATPPRFLAATKAGAVEEVATRASAGTRGALTFELGATTVVCEKAQGKGALTIAQEISQPVKFSKCSTSVTFNGTPLTLKTKLTGAPVFGFSPGGGTFLETSSPNETGEEELVLTASVPALKCEIRIYSGYYFEGESTYFNEEAPTSHTGSFPSGYQHTLEASTTQELSYEDVGSCAGENAGERQDGSYSGTLLIESPKADLRSAPGEGGWNEVENCQSFNHCTPPT
jgi:hypothetical protein